ncbi:uracil-DNA glycosylase [Cucumibacter marinus]|uniref:uracil-DNA glycosylase n=1 Tax=Cucumibacter marinus TaxID=1121252 RepID=UPI000425CE19|nr:uracil-DNA glycosylase [Cucumibacter marinus]
MSETPALAEPPHDCALCPRLADFRHDNARQYPEFFNAPVPSWGDANAAIMIVGLAPGLKGANATGRPFTGDYAGDLLYETLKKFGLASGEYDKRPDDSLRLHNVRICNAVRCVPPQNKPTGAEIKTCRPFLTGNIEAHAPIKVFVTLGRIAHDTLLTTLDLKRSAYPFGHAARHDLPDGRVIYDSYHCSRYNTNTGRLTTEMFEDVIGKAKAAAG